MAAILYIFLMLAPGGSENQAVALFQKGNEAYQKVDFQRAAEHYEAALKQGYESAALYFNLGNSYFKTKEIGRCILNYEKAQQLAPRDPDILYNLQIAQLFVIDKISIPPPFFLFKIWSDIKNTLGSNQLSILALLFYCLTIGLIIVRLLVRKASLQIYARFAAIPIAVLFFIFAFLFAIRVNDDIKTKEAIVMIDKVPVTSSPALDATEVFALHEGAKVRVTDTSGAFSRISLQDGKTGWLPSKTIEKI
jgi:tetratricopeptide (TPR) repeat protein